MKNQLIGLVHTREVGIHQAAMLVLILSALRTLDAVTVTGRSRCFNALLLIAVFMHCF